MLVNVETKRQLITINICNRDAMISYITNI